MFITLADFLFVITIMSLVQTGKAFRVVRRLSTCSKRQISTLDSICREDFPVVSSVDAYQGKKLVFLDSAASSQKPNVVLDAMSNYYRTTHANVHRGAYSIANRATDLFENSRVKVQSFVNAKNKEDIVFTSGATDAINLVALSYGQRLQPGDEVILSVMEHHSNIVPWQLACSKAGAKLKFVQLSSDMKFDSDHFRSLLSPRTRIVAVSYASNILGTINPVREIIETAHRHGAIVLLDACQAAPHIPIDVQELDVDFLAASGHKMCGPTGIGFLYGKKELLESMPPVRGGGEMIETVTLQGSTYAPPPHRFEAGTPPIAEAIGLGVACEYLSRIGMKRIESHQRQLGEYLYRQLQSIPGITIYGPPIDDSKGARTGLVSFNVKGVHATDLALFLDQEGIAVRSGHHCAQPLHAALGAQSGSLRASVYLHNNQHDVDYFVDKLKETLTMFASTSA